MWRLYSLGNALIGTALHNPYRFRLKTSKFIEPIIYMWIPVLVLSALLATGFQPCYGTSRANISVTANGTDSVPCLLNGSFPCKTLHYVLEFLSNARTISMTAATVMLRDHQQLMQPNTYSLPRSFSLVIKGTKTHRARIGCSRSPLTFRSLHGSVTMERLAFDKCSGPNGIELGYLSFLDCTVTDSGGIGVINTTMVSIVSSVFAFIQPYSREANLVVLHTTPATTSVLVSNCTFSCQYHYSWSAAACIWVTNGNVQVNGNLTIANCTGYLGGAVRLTRSTVTAVGEANVNFVNNFAQFGSAVYLEGGSCPLLNTSNGVLNVRATNSKQSCVFIENPASLRDCLSLVTFLHLFGNDSNCSPSSSATSLSVQVDTSTSVISPGMDLVINLLVTDYFENRAKCEGGVYLLDNQQSGATVQCNSPVDSTIYLSCPLYMPHKQHMTFISELGWNSTVRFKSMIEPRNATLNVSLTFACGTNGGPNASVQLQLHKCPTFIMQFNNITHTCECITPTIGRSNYLCSANQGIACIRSGHWKGWDRNRSVVLPCSSRACKPSGSPCPLTTDTSFHLLDPQPDKQCYANKAELLCSRCKDGYYFSFPPLRCLPSSCSLAHSFGLLIILITFEFTKVIVIFMVVSNKLGAVFGKGGMLSRKSLGVGYFFGSLFFMAAIGRLPIMSLPQFYALHWVVQAFRTITHLPLDVFGEIQWCFFPSFGALGIFACQYLGPAVALVMLAALFIFVHLCPKALSKFHPSPMQSISLLILFTFWSLAATSINILQYREVGEDTRAQLQPDLPYFTGLHLPLAIISIVLLLFLIFPLVFFLLLSPFLWKCVNLNKFKPFLDEFQSCYKKSYRWYPAIYFMAWLIIVGVDSMAIYLTIYTVVFFTLCVLLAVFQPYEVRWLNTVDMLLLLDLLVTTMLLLRQTLLDSESVVITGMVYMLMLIPLVFISAGIFFLFAMQCQTCRFRCQKDKAASTKEKSVPLVRVNQPAKIGDISESWSGNACLSRDSIIADRF